MYAHSSSTVLLKLCFSLRSQSHKAQDANLTKPVVSLFQASTDNHSVAFLLICTGQNFRSSLLVHLNLKKKNLESPTNRHLSVLAGGFRKIHHSNKCSLHKCFKPLSRMFLMILFSFKYRFVTPACYFSTQWIPVSSTCAVSA